ncbi:MAG: hypothetical protein ACXW3N_10190, partial [Rhodoplanes sp.]
MARTAKLSLVISTALAFVSIGLAAPSAAEPLPLAATGVRTSSVIDRYVHDDRVREDVQASAPG